MANSLETRLPLLDHRVVEFSWRLPDSMKLHGRTTKRLLRAILARYLPRHLYERPKMGFSVPLDRWLRGALKEWATAMLDSSVFYSTFPVQPRKVRALWAEYQTGAGPSANEVWAVVTLAAWANVVHSEAAVRIPAIVTGCSGRT
jgi:asparagine synthase (glutamine-hydrolysing)